MRVTQGQGLSAKQVRLCDSFVYIPQYGGGTASLNVTVAASIILQNFAVWAGYQERQRDGAKFVVDERPPRTRSKSECRVRSMCRALLGAVSSHAVVMRQVQLSFSADVDAAAPYLPACCWYPVKCLHVPISTAVPPNHGHGRRMFTHPPTPMLACDHLQVRCHLVGTQQQCGLVDRELGQQREAPGWKKP